MPLPVSKTPEMHQPMSEARLLALSDVEAVILAGVRAGVATAGLRVVLEPSARPAEVAVTRVTAELLFSQLVRLPIVCGWCSGTPWEQACAWEHGVLEARMASLVDRARWALAVSCRRAKGR